MGSGRGFVLAAALTCAIGALLAPGAHAASCPDLSGHYVIRDVSKSCDATSPDAEWFMLGSSEEPFMTIWEPTELWVTQEGCDSVKLRWIDDREHEKTVSTSDGYDWEKNALVHAEHDGGATIHAPVPGVSRHSQKWSFSVDRSGSLVIRSRDVTFGLYFFLAPMGHWTSARCRFEKIAD